MNNFGYTEFKCYKHFYLTNPSLLNLCRMNKCHVTSIKVANNFIYFKCWGEFQHRQFIYTNYVYFTFGHTGDEQ